MAIIEQRPPKNPFLLTGYHSPTYFCDRKDELAWLQDQVSNERNVVLHAVRRIGKSVLIQHLFYHLEKTKKADTIYIDLLGTHSLQSANERIGKAIINKYGDLRKGLKATLLQLVSVLGATFSLDSSTGLPQVAFSSTSSSSPDQSLDAVGEFLKNSKKKIVICLDEFQEISNYPEKEAEALFRTWTQSYPMIRFIFSGSHQHLMQTMFTDRSRPFYKSAQIKSLDTIDKAVYTKFILNHFTKGKKKLKSELVKQILSWTKGQTYYVQVVCNKLYASASADDLTLSAIFQETIEQEIPIFSTYQRLLTAFQWKVLVAVAKSEKIKNPLSKDFINQYALGTPSSVSTALKKLVNTELIARDEGYEVQDVLLMRWLQKL